MAFPLWHWELTQNPQVTAPIHRVETGTHTIIFQPEAAVYAAAWPYLDRMPAGVTADRTAFAGAIRLRGFERGAVETNTLPLTLYWESEAPLAGEFDVFVHILDEKGEIVAQADRQPVYGLAPTSLWQPGDLVRDRYELALPAALQPGEYAIRAGFFDRESGARLPVTEGEAKNHAALVDRFTLTGQDR